MIAGINIRKIDAKREELVGSGLGITNSPAIVDLKERTLDGTDKKALFINFTYKCVYKGGEKEVANIDMAGDVIYIDDDSAQVLKHWKDNGRLPVDFAIGMINAIMRKCVTKVVELADDLQLPPPIDFPRVQKVPETQETGKKGKNKAA